MTVAEENLTKDPSALMKFLEKTYDTVTGDLPVVGSPKDLAKNFLKEGKSKHSSIDTLIRYQMTKTASSGFITGIGGLITLPISLPADIAHSYYVQLRMIAAIGHIYEHDIHSDQVRTLCIACLCGKAVQDVLKDIGVKAGQQFTKKLIQSISGETIKAINKAVGMRLVTKFGEKGVINLGKAIPVVGAGIGASVNAISTYSIGKTAKKMLDPEEGN